MDDDLHVLDLPNKQWSIASSFFFSILCRGNGTVKVRFTRENISRVNAQR